MAQTKSKTTATKKTTAKTKVEEDAALESAETAVAQETAEKTAHVKDTRDEQIEMLMREIEALKAAQAQPQVIQIKQDEEQVHFIWQAEVAQENVLAFGDHGQYGRITGKTGSVYIPKKDLSRVLDERTRHLIDMRWLIVVSGLSDDERAALGVKYKPGEVLTEKAFNNIVELGDDILTVYPQLCEGNRRIVAQRYAEAYRNGDPAVTRERVVALNNLSKEAGSKDPKGDFIAIIEAMNEADTD